MKKLLYLLLLIPFGAFGQTQVINVGTVANDHTGDPIRTAFIKVNTNRVAIVDTFAIHRALIVNRYTKTESQVLVNTRLEDKIDSGVDLATYVTAALNDFGGTGSGFNEHNVQFIVDVTAGEPDNGDTIYTDVNLIGKSVKLSRGTTADLHSQWRNTTATNGRTGYRFDATTGTVTVRPAFATNDRVWIRAYDPVNETWTSPTGGTSTLMTGLIGYYALDEISGTTADNSKGYLLTTNLNAGTISGTVNQVGKLGRSVYFDDDVVDIAQVDADEQLAGSTVTIGGWFNLDILPGTLAHESYLIRAGVIASPYESVILTVGTDNKPVFHVKNTSGTDYEVTTTGALTVDTWYHIVCVLGAGGTMKIYLNGADVSSGAETFTGTILVNDSSWFIGNAYDAAGSGLRGYADEVFIYNNTEMSSGNVTILYNGGVGLAYPFL